jgi:hypothetical protein
MQEMASGSGVPDQFEANAAVGVTAVVKVTATSRADPTKSMTVSVTIHPSPEPAEGVAPQSATIGTAYSLALATFLHGGTPPFTCTLSSGSLPAGLSLDASTATITGTPTTVTEPVVATYACKDSASPPVSLLSALDVSIQVSQVLPPVDAGTVVQMNTARYGHTATLLPNGSVLIAGGAYLSDGGPTLYLTSAELYNPSTTSFAKTGALTRARFAHTASLLRSGKVLLAGGASSRTAELYDPSSGVFNAASAMMTVSRSSHSATTLLDGRVLIVGGRGGNNEVLASAEIYDPVATEFSSVGTLSTARAEHAAALLGDGRVLITGGTDGKMALASAEIFDPRSNSFSVTGSMSVPRLLHTATALDLGTILVAGGLDLLNPAQFAHPTASAELYDPKSGSFVATGSMVTARASHTATLRADGSVVLVGGGGGVAGNPYCDGHLVGNCWPPVVLLPTASVEVYDPQTNGFLESPVLTLARESHTTTLLANGTLLVAGGQVLNQTRYQTEYVDTLPATRSAQVLVQTAPVPTPVIQGFSSVLTPCEIRFLCGGPYYTITANITYSVPLAKVEISTEGRPMRALLKPPYRWECPPSIALFFTVIATDEDGNVATRSVRCF